MAKVSWPIQATELIIQRSTVFANIRRAQEETLLQNSLFLANTLDELEYTTCRTIRTILDSTFNKKVTLTIGHLVFPTTFPYQSRLQLPHKSEESNSASLAVKNLFLKLISNTGNSKLDPLADDIFQDALKGSLTTFNPSEFNHHHIESATKNSRHGRLKNNKRTKG